jgi:hypothetical protein
MNYPNGGFGYPGKLQAVAIIQTVVGALEILGSMIGIIWVLLFGIATFGIGLIAIPIPLVVLLVGILSLVAGIKGINKNPSYGLSLGVAISQMFGLFLCDVISFGCGLAALILMLQDEVKNYFR